MTIASIALVAFMTLATYNRKMRSDPITTSATIGNIQQQVSMLLSFTTLVWSVLEALTSHKVPAIVLTPPLQTMTTPTSDPLRFGTRLASDEG